MQVRFPKHRRELGIQYNAIRSERFDAVLRKALRDDAVCRARSTHVRHNGVALENGQLIRAGGVIDTRGTGQLRFLDGGWQKFLGQELRLAAPHRVSQPIVMDATVAQDDGYRFVYVLPFARDRLLSRIPIIVTRRRSTAIGWQGGSRTMPPPTGGTWPRCARGCGCAAGADGGRFRRLLAFGKL
jgi:hypothetical protein